MVQGSPRSGEEIAANSALDTREVAGKGKRNRRKRTTAAGTVRRINARARERQAAWLETGQPNLTYRLTRELDGLYGEHRDEQAGTLTDPFRYDHPGRTR
jgi:hypothetical protein